MSNITLNIKDKIAFIEFDHQDLEVNVLSTDSMLELARIIRELANKTDPDIKALILRSKKAGIFIAGADIKEIENISSVEEAKEKAEKGKEILNDLHDLNLITVAAINGACLGGGFELTLACKYRVASFSNKVKIGLPEVKLGVIPGFGGTQRLPRLIGLTRALTMILSGKIVSGKDALKYGIVDRLFPDVTLIDDTIDFVNGLLENSVSVKRKHKKKLLQSFLEDSPIGRAIVFNQARKNVLKQTKGFYPAPLKALEIIKRTYGRDIKKGSILESNAFGELAVTDISKNLIKIFYLNEKYKKLPWVDHEIKPAAINKCGILGAGVMGGGIAQLVSFNDIPVRIKDINYDALKTALKTASKLFAYAIKKRKLKKHQVEYKLGLISPTITYEGFKNCDLVIEAVMEDLNIKEKVFTELGEAASNKTIFASNTSALPIIKMAQASGAPERVVGMHFFNPVHRMPLVEVIRTTKTSEKSLATVIAFARKMGKVVIVVKDVPGFLINRILLSYMNEGGFLLEDGVKIERIDKIARNFGMPMGPFELIDEVGIDVGYKVARILEAAYADRMQVCPILSKVKSEGLLGKKAKLGFYVHEGKKRRPNDNIYKLLSSSLPGGEAAGAQKTILDEVALKRMIYVMINEAARCLEEGVVDTPETIDIGMIMGTGFPPFRGGLLRYADSVGIKNIVNDLEAFKMEFNAQRLEPCKLLLDKAGENKTFYFK